jgi:Flp pilus assembly protein TadG
MRKRTHPRSHREGGQALIETALMMIVIITVVFSIFELSWLMYTYSVLADAANEGVRYAIVHSGGDPTGTQAKVKAFASASMHNVNAISTSVTFPDGGSSTPPNRVRVSVTYAYIPILPKFITAPTMHSFAEGRMVAQ